MDVSANKDGRSFETEYSFGETLEESVEKYSEELVHKLFIKKAKIKLQGKIRRCLKAGMSEEEIQQEIDEWELGVTSRKSKKEKYVDQFKKLDKDERQKYIEKLIDIAEEDEQEEQDTTVPGM